LLIEKFKVKGSVCDNRTVNLVYPFQLLGHITCRDFDKDFFKLVFRKNYQRADGVVQGRKMKIFDDPNDLSLSPGH
jgi:hypothetical protein